MSLKHGSATLYSVESGNVQLRYGKVQLPYLIVLVRVYYSPSTHSPGGV